MAIINGDANNNTLESKDDEPDTINGFGGNDTLFGFGGDDTLDGGAEGDVINGGNGFDTVSFASASQAVNVDLRVNLGGGDTLFPSSTSTARSSAMS